MCIIYSFEAVIQLLSGDGEMDLSMEELKECWANGALESTRVDRQGFKSVWLEVQEYFRETRHVAPLVPLIY